MRAQLTSAIRGMTEPTGWHYHTCEGQFVYVLKGWVDLEFEGGESIHLAASPTSNQATKLVEHRCERGLARPFVAVGEITRRKDMVVGIDSVQLRSSAHSSVEL